MSVTPLQYLFFWKRKAKQFLLPAAAAILLLSYGCGQQDSASNKTAQETRPAGDRSNADLIRNPVSAQDPGNTADFPKMEFDHEIYDFGEIPDDKIVEHNFAFTNTGKSPLVISHARGSCGCTVPHWPKDPIPPGGKGSISVRFDPTGREGQQSKTVAITANTYPNTINISISAAIKPGNNKQ